MKIICLIVVSVWLFGCSSLVVSADKKCKATNLAGDTWANSSLTSVLTFNDDCTGVVQMCNKYFTYDVVDFNIVYINVNTTNVVSASVRPGCPDKGVYKCLYSLTHLTESNVEVMDISCAWTNYKTEQVTRYEKN